MPNSLNSWIHSFLVSANQEASTTVESVSGVNFRKPSKNKKIFLKKTKKTILKKDHVREKQKMIKQRQLFGYSPPKRIYISSWETQFSHKCLHAHITSYHLPPATSHQKG